MITTTTHTVDGYRIVQYFPPVVANVVAGTGALNDLVASISDVFGGSSQTYQSALAGMYATAQRDLQDKAGAAGANCLVGVQFDLGQISGKGMQMFMLSAVATPVTIKTDAEMAADAVTEDAARVATARVAAERRERFAGVESIEGLLTDPEIARQARETRRLYGRNVCVSYLQEKAAELGLGHLDISAADLPDVF